MTVYLHGCWGRSKGQFENHNNSQKTHHTGRRMYLELPIIKQDSITNDCRQIVVKYMLWHLGSRNALIPTLGTAACPGVVVVLAAVTVAGGTGATGTDAASIPGRCAGWGFASNCWASGNACNKSNNNNLTVTTFVQWDYKVLNCR